jgi:stage II sporulation SpoAA-like protein
MFKVLDGSDGNVLGVEISESYTKQDVQEFEKTCENTAAQGFDQLNILVKLDALKLRDVKFGAFVEDSKYALQHMDQMRHLAIVGNSDMLKHLATMDNAIFGSKAKERIEKYFDVADLDQAWDFVRS